MRKLKTSLLCSPDPLCRNGQRKGCLRKRKWLYFRRNLTPSSNSPIMIPADYKTFTKERVLCYLLTLIITT